MSPARAPKLWTLAEAQRSLPLVSRCVRDAQAAFRRICRLRNRLDRTATPVVGPARVVSPWTAARMRKRHDEAIVALAELIDELDGYGVELRDYERGDLLWPAACGPGFWAWRPGDRGVLHFVAPGDPCEARVLGCFARTLQTGEASAC